MNFRTIFLSFGMFAFMLMPVSAQDAGDDDVSEQLSEIISILGSLSQRVEKLENTPAPEVATASPQREYVRGLKLSVYGTNQGQSWSGTAPTSVAGLESFGEIELENPLPFSFGAYSADQKISSRHADRVRALVWDGFINLPYGGKNELEIRYTSPRDDVGCSVQLDIDGVNVLQFANGQFNVTTKPSFAEFTAPVGLYSFKLFMACNRAASHGNLKGLSLPVPDHGGVSVSLSITPENESDTFRLGSRHFMMKNDG